MVDSVPKAPFSVRASVVWMWTGGNMVLSVPCLVPTCWPSCSRIKKEYAQVIPSALVLEARTGQASGPETLIQCREGAGEQVFGQLSGRLSVVTDPKRAACTRAGHLSS